jgi:hypothetical protein
VIRTRATSIVLPPATKRSVCANAAIVTGEDGHLVLAVRLDKNRLRANPGAFAIGEHFRPDPGLLAAIERHLTPIPDPPAAQNE